MTLYTSITLYIYIKYITYYIDKETINKMSCPNIPKSISIYVKHKIGRRWCLNNSLSTVL